jgi:signal transduction histidine kinase
LASGESRYINQFKLHTEISIELPHPDTIEAVMGIPLVREGSIIGVLALVDRHNPERFTIRDLDKANAFAVQVAIAIHNAQLVTSLRELNEQLDQRVATRTRDLGEERDRFLMLLRITTELSASLDEDRVLGRALELINGVVHASEGLILLIDESSREFVIRAAFGMETNIPPRGRPSGMMRDEGLAGWVVANREAVILHHAPDDPRWTDRPNARHYRSVLGVPLIFSGEVVGVLMLFHTEPNAFTEQHLKLVEGAGAQVSNAIYNAHLYLLIRNQAERVGGMLREEQVNTAKMQAILESIADGVLVANEQGQAILVNVACSEILGIGRDQLLGQNLFRLSGVYGSAGDLWLQTIQDWASQSEQIEGQSYLADELFIPDENKVVSVHVAPVLVGGQYFGTVSIFRDRTKEVEVDRVKTEFVSTVSHELRTPLTSIKGYTDLMLMGATGPVGEAQLRYLKVIKNNADRLQELVNDLLDISRLETGKTRLNLRPIDISQVVHHVVDHLKGRINHEEKEMHVVVQVPAKLPLAHADYTRVTQILTNLADNAFNYTAPNGRITIATAVRDEQIYLSVRDTGIGIAPEYLDKIFDRFFRSDDMRVQKVSGTGLGLPIVKSLVEMHGGHLIVESVVGEGSVFTFNLPIVRQEGRVVKEKSEK